MNYFKAAFLQENETKMSALEVFTLFGGESLSDVSDPLSVVPVTAWLVSGVYL